jgi:hypothetical protein
MPWSIFCTRFPGLFLTNLHENSAESGFWADEKVTKNYLTDKGGI